MSRQRSAAPLRPGLPLPDCLIEAGALFLLVFTPLAFGTVQPWSEAVAECVILAMAVIWVLAMLRRGELRLALPAGWLPAGLFLGLLLLQTVPLPAWLATLVSPTSAALARDAAAFTGASAGFIPISLDPHATWRASLKVLALALFFLVCFNAYRTREQARRALWLMLVMGTVISLFGIAQRATWTDRLYWFGPPVLGSAFGPFVNRAHFAGLMVVVVPMALALVLADRRESQRPRLPRRWADRVRQWNSCGTGPARLIPLLILVMGGAALVSGSRGGVVALLAALLAMIGLSALDRARRGRAIRVAVAAALIILAGAWIGGDILYSTLERLAEEVGRPEGSTRVEIWTDALALWAQFPALGSGLGTFRVAFPGVRTSRLPYTFTHAESDWVQLLTDTGAGGLLLAVLAVGTFGLSLVRRYRVTESRWARALTLGGLVALVGTTVQGIGNYNLPVMSNFVYLALALAVAARSGEVQGDREVPRSVS